MRGTALLRLLLTLFFVSAVGWAMAAETNQKPIEPNEPPFDGPVEPPFGGPPPLFRGLAPSTGERRVALIVANASYKEAPLQNPLVDANIVRPALKKLGFGVTVLENADYETFVRGLHDFYGNAKGADIALFYYSGHGFGYNNENYLMSTSAKLNSDLIEMTLRDAVNLDDVVREISTEAKISLFFVDACRQKPRASRGGGAGQGLVRYPNTNNQKVFVGLSTRLGELARDGKPGQGSPFARAFAKQMTVPGRRLVDSFAQVKLNVMLATNGSQRPVSRNDIDGRLTLLPVEPVNVPASSAPNQVLAPVAESTPPSHADWGAIAYEDYKVSPGNKFGFSTGAATRDDAVRQAVDECKRVSDWKDSYFWYGCTVADRGVEGYDAVVHDQCIALYSNDNGIWRYAKARSEAAASEKARLACMGAASRMFPCKKVRSFCTGSALQ